MIMAIMAIIAMVIIVIIVIKKLQKNILMELIDLIIQKDIYWKIVCHVAQTAITLSVIM